MSHESTVTQLGDNGATAAHTASEALADRADAHVEWSALAEPGDQAAG